MYLGTIILIIYLPLVFVLFMVNETFWGLIGSAAVIVGAIFALILEMRRGRGDINSMLDFLRNSAASTIDEKIAVLYAYTNHVPKWKEEGINIDYMRYQILADISSIAKIRGRMGWEQWRELIRVLGLLIEAMQKEGIDAKEIQVSLEALK
jgi:hypothetical protein